MLTIKGFGLFLAAILISFFTFWTFQGTSAQNPGTDPQDTLLSKVTALQAPSEEVAYQRFIAFGDSGSGNSNQFKVAEQMVNTHDKTGFTQALMLGDNIYEVGDVKDLGEARFTKPYKPLLDRGVRFITALGNHDVLFGHGDDQVEFFNMPGRYYTVKSGNIKFFVIDSNTMSKSIKEQQWLKNALEESDARWKIVMGHHPLYTSGAHASEGTVNNLRKVLEPILIENRVPLYLAGHDHGYERFAPIQGVQYIVSGGAGAWLRDFKTPHPQSLIREKKYHFLYFEETENSLNFQAIDITGAIIDQGSIPLPAAALEPQRKAA